MSNPPACVFRFVWKGCGGGSEEKGRCNTDPAYPETKLLRDETEPVLNLQPQHTEVPK